MNTKKRIAFSIVAALAIFMTAAILAHYCYGMLPESLQNSIDFVFYASAILFESTTAIVAFFISGIFIAAVFIVFFFIFFLLLGIKKDYSQKITELIEETQTEVTKEYLENIEILPWEQVLVQLEQRKQLLIDELKSKYGQKSLKYIDLIDSSADESWKKIEGTLRKQKLLAAKRNALSQQQEPVSSAGIGLRLWGSLGYSGESEDDFDIDEDFLEELNEPDEINPLEVIGELEEIEELESSAESVDNGDFDVIEQLEVVDENLDELEEPEELDDMEEMEELEEIETRDPYPDLMLSLKNKPIYIANSNLTFISSINDDFASVDNVFAEDLTIGKEYIEVNNMKIKNMLNEQFSFVPVHLDFLADKKNIDEPLPADENVCFSLTSFSENKPDSMELEELEELDGENAQTIVEVGGVFSIAENLSYDGVQQDSCFKDLVDSVIR